MNCVIKHCKCPKKSMNIFAKKNENQEISNRKKIPPTGDTNSLER